jgi:ABC-2 type transport system permease protein
MLGGQSAGMMAEEKGNKVIEILVAAIHIESIFMGKLVGLFAIAMTFIAFWSALLGIGFAALPITVQSVLADATPAIGLPWFFTLGTIYFTMSFMLLGAIFLGMGALASSMREVQMMSLPITALQVGMFALANAAASAPGTEIATFAEIFPFSSPFAMAARGATDSAILPHFAAILWQALWVGLVIYGAARLFKRGVLKSGGRFFSRKKVAATNG